ncbi:SDR family NAD(P)-dependent oxidoreductase [Xylophilus sp. Kf1]|nr:SDR family NAD(P)-dependent oxidoreductase [Xylophilus sp. Kf1]
MKAPPALRALAAEGASVVNYSSSREGADKVVADITAAGGKAVAIGGSVAVAADVDRLFDEVKKAYGRVDVLVNNACVYAFSPIEAVKADEYRRQFDTNVMGTLLTVKAALPLFPAAGGSVVNTGETLYVSGGSAI